MNFDFFASMSESKTWAKRINEAGLVSGFVDGCTVWLCQDKPKGKKVPDPKNEARKFYMKRSGSMPRQSLILPDGLDFEPDFQQLPNSTWFGIEVSFALKSPWYSKDDRSFHVLDNPVRKDRVFGVPYMSASSWKGLLRWACRMETGLLEKMEQTNNEIIDEPWIIHLFGNEKEKQKDFKSGALAFYPTWFDRIGFEVINPHNRPRRAGTQPIYYEVVPADTQGKLQLLYAPLPKKNEEDAINPLDFIDPLVQSINNLLETFGISAKRTTGWGTAKISKWKGVLGNGKIIDDIKDSQDFAMELKKRLTPQGDS